ncbi:hypothetical protein DRN85_07850 [Methanosarcinales archaeon]|nr:MAG: hypothetical protein DRN85_07850 [Methanosarcinales archaeon]
MKPLILSVLVVGSLLLAGCISTDNFTPKEQIEYFKNLPPKPDDFDLVERDLYTGYIDLCALSEGYYLQPEFYGESWKRGEYFYTHHDYTRWAVHGHGAFPANPVFVFGDPKVGSWISDCVFYRTGWGVETYQGIRLVADPSEYFDVKITPDEFLLPPTYPVFDKGWVKKININVSIKNTPPPGKYIINVNTVSPSVESSKRWFKEVFSKNMTEEQRIMVEQCIEQGGSNCQELIDVGRRNKYVDGSNIQVGPRLTITIYVK